MSHQLLLARAKARIASGQEPYNKLLERLQKDDSCQIKDKTEADDYEEATAFANQAKRLAFRYWTTHDPILARRAAQLMAKMKTDIPKGYLLQIATGVQDILQMSEALTAFAQAYHFLKAGEYPPLALATVNLTKLTNETSKLVKAILTYGQPLSKVLGIVTRHNYLLKGSSAVGLAGLYLNRPEWVALGQKGVNAVRDVQGPNLERGWGEGSNYFEYAARNFLPFFIALNRQISAESENFSGVLLENYLADPIWKTVFLWYLKTRLPTGERPGVDDARYTPFFSGLLATDPALSEHATDHFEVPASFWSWDWYTAELRVAQGANRFYSGDTVDLTADMIINFDHRLPRIEPTGEGFEPTQISRVCGQAVLRSGWNREAVYFLLQGEEKKMAEAGGSHEHNDGTSFILCAYGELLALDPGYPGWQRREQTNKPEHHNRILIANHAPEATALLDHFFELPHLEGVQSSTWFSPKNGKRPRHERNVLFINKSFFVLDDLVRDAGNNEVVSYIHGHGGGTLQAQAAFHPQEHGGVWQRERASLQVYQTTSVGAPRFSHQQNAHSVFWMADKTPVPQHDALTAAQRGDTLRFLTVLYPQPTSARAPVKVESLPLAHGNMLQLTEINDAGEACYTLLLSRTSATSSERCATPWGEALCNGNFVMLAGGAQPQLIYCDGVTIVELNRKPHFRARSPFHGALEWDEPNDEISGWQLSAAASNRLEIFTRTEPLVLVGLKKLGFEKNTGILSVEIEATTRDFAIRMSVSPFRVLRLMPTTGIHPWLPYGDGEDYLHDGAGLLLQRANASGRFFGYQRHGLTILPNTRYRLRCRVKTELQNGFVAAGLGEWSGAETHHDFGFVSGAQDWQEISGEWLSPPDGKSIALVLYGSENFQGRAWFKEAFLEEVGS